MKKEGLGKCKEGWLAKDPVTRFVFTSRLLPLSIVCCSTFGGYSHNMQLNPGCISPDEQSDGL